MIRYEDIQFTWWKRVNKMNINKNINIIDFYDDIRGNTYKKTIEQLRTLTDDEEIRNHKTANLPAVTLGGKFKDGSHIYENLENPSCYISIDIDHLPSEEEVHRVKELIVNDKHSIITFISPYGRGIKSVFYCSKAKTKEEYEIAWMQIKEYFLTNYNINIDEQTKNLNRLCYVSCDNNAVLNLEAEEFMTVDHISSNEYKKAFDVKGTLQGVSKGERNSELFKLACSLYAKDLNDSDVLSMLDVANSKSKPPLSVSELVSIRDSAKKQHNKNKKTKKVFKEIKSPVQEVHIVEGVSVKLNNFVFDENEIITNRIFPLCKISEELLGIGLFLPKNVEKYKEDVYIGIEQKQIPVLITSSKVTDERIQEIGDNLKKEHKIQILNIPSEQDYPKRWRLKSIKQYLQSKEQFIDGREIYSKIKGEYVSYVYFAEKEWYDIHTLWDIGSYFHQLFLYYPIMELRGLKATGKTKVMTISRQFSFNASEELTNPSESALFRDTEEKRGAKYIDEAEKLFTINKGKVEGDSRAELINSSYKYTGTVPRVEKVGSKFVTRIYHTYSPTMVCSINGLYGATESRAIVHVMTKNPEKDDRGNREINEHSDIYPSTRDDLYIYLMQNWDAIKTLYDSYTCDKIKSRDYWILKPLLVIAKYIDEEVHSRLLKFFIKLSEIRKIDYIGEGSNEYKILDALKKLIGRKFILVKDVASSIGGDEYKLSNRSIARIIDNLGFRDYKDHTREGNGYEIPQELFFSVLSTICPQLIDLSSQSSQCSHIEDDELKLSEDSVNIGEDRLSEESICEDGDSREDTFEMKMLKIRDSHKNLPIPQSEFLGEGISQEQLNKLSFEGKIVENPSGVYRLL